MKIQLKEGYEPRIMVATGQLAVAGEPVEVPDDLAEAMIQPGTLFERVGIPAPPKKTPSRPKGAEE